MSNLSNPGKIFLFYLRLLLVFAILTSEIIGLTSLFDFRVDELLNSPNPLIHLFSKASALLKLVVSFAGAFLLLISPRLKAIDLELRQASHHWQLWLLLQLAVFSLLVLYTAKILPASSHVISLFPAITTQPGPAWYAGWFFMGGLTIVPLVLALAPWRFWAGLVRREYPAMLVAAFSAILILMGVMLSEEIGAPLSEISVQVAHQVLVLIYPDVVYNFELRQLGLPAFSVLISPGCSGYEGMIMITVFITLYLWMFHKSLRFPVVLSLFPLGFTAIWLANILRIVSMITFGAFVSPGIAMGGLHSQAGWITFTLIALALIALSRRWFAIEKSASKDGQPHSMANALLMPLLVMMGMLMLTSALSAGFETLYPLRMLVTATALWYYRRSYQGLGWGWSWQAAGIGVLVFVMWILLEPTANDSGKALQAHVAELPEWLMLTWLTFRVLGSVLVVPVVEELAFRSYLLRQLIAEEFENVPATRFTWLSFMVSSVAFGLLHGRWLAGVLAGMAFALAVYRRGRIGDAVLAHMVANALIAFSVLILGNWSLWA